MKSSRIILIMVISGLCLSVAVPASPKDNTPPPGFKLLFNGKNLKGWQGGIPLPERAKLSKSQLAVKQREANQEIMPHWTVDEGVLNYDGKVKIQDNLQTIRDYSDFELWVDWKIGPKGDSGIYLRGNPQVQIWDANNNPVGSGGLFNDKKHPSNPLKRADKPIGDWNTFHIIMRGDEVTVWLNGELVVDHEPLENYWDSDKPLPATGPIELQNHGDPLDFKNIYIKRLPREE